MLVNPNTISNPDDIDNIVMARKGPGYREMLKDMVQEKVDAANADSNSTSEDFPGNGNNAPQSQSTTPEEETFKKRYGDLRRHSEKMRQDFQAEVNKLREQLTATTQKTMALPKTKAEVEAWIKQYPDVAGIVESIASVKANEASQVALERMKRLEEEAFEARISRAEEVMRRLHPDFDELRENQDLHDWAAQQEPQIQSWLYDNPDNPVLCAKAIDLYKLDRGVKAAPAPKKPSTQNRDLEASRMVKPSSAPQEPSNGNKGPVFKESDILKLSQKQYEKLEAEIDKATRDGRIVYDVSGRK